MNTNETLGFPKDSRLLIVNIDDYGLCYTGNQSAIQLLEKGAASSCTIMAPAPLAIQGIMLVNEHARIHCGVHLTAISEHNHYRWRPLCSPEIVASLVDEHLYFFMETRQDQFIQKANVNELEIEWRTQIEFVLQRGIRITHLDSHCNVHDSRDDIFAMTFELALEYGVPLRVHNEKHLYTIKQQGLPVIDYPDLDSFRVPLENKNAIYAQYLRELPEGLSEWAIHPAYESGELRAITPEWPVRASDYEFFNSGEYLEIIKSEGIQLVDYSLLKPFWLSH